MPVFVNDLAPGATQFQEENEGEKSGKMAVLCNRQRILMYVVVILAVLSIVLFGVLMWSVSKPPVEYSEGFVRASAGLRENMDPTADPCQDFYQFACGGWMKRNTIPDDMEQWSNFVILGDQTLVTTRNLLMDLEKTDPLNLPTYVTKLMSYFNGCSNTTDMDVAATDDLQKFVEDKILSASLEKAIIAAAELHVSKYFSLFVEPDSHQPNMNSLFAIQGALGMPLKEHYTNDLVNEDRQSYYKQFLKELWLLQGEEPESAMEITTEVYAFEKCIAEGMLTPAEERQKSDKMPPHQWEDITKNNTIAKERLTAMVRARLGEGVTIPTGTIVYYFNEYMEQIQTCLTELATDESFEKQYIATRVMLKYAVSGKEAWRDLDWEYKVNITGVEQKQPAWKTCISATKQYMPEALGRIFANETFKPSAKEDTLSMIGDIKEAFSQLLPALEWMDDETRGKAEEKAVAVGNKIGYPEWIMDDKKIAAYLNFELPGDKLRNNWALDKFLTQRSFSMLGKAVDKNKWYMSPATVNAYYNPKGNEMVFPAAILQPPFYHVDFPKYVNYGAIGVVIGHELTHGFDDNGRKYSKSGELDEWYTGTALDGFNKRAKCMSDQYSTYSVEGFPVNGNLTLGENIADNGGVKQAYIAYQNWVERNGEELELPGMDLTNKQAFFLSYAQIWCQKKTKSAFEMMTKVDPHSPGMFRIKGPLVNSREFAAAYSCPVDSPMNPPQSEKCEVW